MQLPIQSTPEYSVELPVSKKTVKYRPFLVKEQRNMIMIKQDASVMEMYYAIVSMLQSVCLSELKIDELPMTDVEYLFMLVRTKSVGETQDVQLECQVEDCDGTAKFKTDLSDIEIEQPKVRTDNNGLVELNEDLSVQLVVPSSKQMMSVMDKDESEMIKAGIKGMLKNLDPYTKLLEDNSLESFEILRKGLHGKTQQGLSN